MTTTSLPTGDRPPTKAPTFFGKAVRQGAWRWLLGLLLLGSLLTRVYAAWTVKHLPWRDSSVVMLMSKHMAEGETLPVFYYGQPYMGSLEPLLSAAVCKVFGFSPMAACAGPVLLGFALVLVICRMAMDLGGPRAAVFATAYLLTGSDALLYLSSHPRGGYMIMLLAGALTLLHVLRYTQGTPARPPGRRMDLVLAGLFAGLGWWNNQLVIVHLLAATALLLPRLRTHLRALHWPWAFAAFLAGSAPWWWWNATNGWQTFTFARSFENPSLRAGAGSLLRLAPVALGFGHLDGGTSLPKLLALFALGAAILAACASAFRDPKAPRGQKSGLLAQVLAIGCMGALFCASHFSSLNTPRYLLPLIPSFALLAGFAIHRLLELPRWRLPAVALFAATLPHTTFSLPDWRDKMPGNDQDWERGRQLGSFLADHCDGVAVGRFLDCWVNVASEEAGSIVNFPEDFHAPNNRRAVLAANQAFLGKHQKIDAFLASSCAEHQRDVVAGFPLVHHIQSPPPPAAYLDRGEVEAIRILPDGGDVTGRLMDEDLESAVTLAAGRRPAQGLACVFRQPVRLEGLLLPNVGHAGFQNLRIEAITGVGERVVLLAECPWTPYFWSGPRVSMLGPGYHQGYRFACPADGIRELILLDQSPDSQAIVLPELLLIPEGQPGPAPGPDERESEARQLLASFPAGRLYAPRWILERLHGELPPDIVASWPAYLLRHYQQLPTRESPLADYLNHDRPLFLLLSHADAARGKSLLAAFGIPIEEERAGATWTSLRIPAPADSTATETWIPLYWTEQGLFKGSRFDHRRLERAAALAKSARRCGDPDRLFDLLADMVRLAPDNRRTVDYATNRLRALGMTTEAAAIRRHAAPYLEPDVPARARFPDGLVFLGASFEEADDHVDVRYFWEVPPSARCWRWSVFVHFTRDGKTLFQDDHNLTDHLAEDDVRAFPFPVVCRITRRIVFPPGERGPYTVKLGLVNPRNGKVASPRSDYHLEKGKVVLPHLLALPAAPSAEKPT